jgi:hypothetical protein
VGDPTLDMEATPSFGQIGIKWHGLAERVSEAITKQLLREIHAALVLPNGGNLILDPLTPFDAVPELSVRALLAMGKTSQASMRDRAAAHDAAEAAEAAEASEQRAPREKRATRETDGSDAFDGPGGSASARAAAFHTPSARSSVEIEDAVRAVVPGGKEEDDAEEAVAAMVDSFMSVNSVGSAADDDDVGDDATRRDATDEWTHSSPSAGVSRTRTGEISANAANAARISTVVYESAVDPDVDPEAKKTPDVSSARASRTPSSPGGGGTIDVRFGAPFPRGGETTKTSASDRPRSSASPTTRARVDPEPNTDLASNLGRFAAGFAAKAARARASMRKDAASVHEGVRRGGVKGGLDVAKSIAARAAKEMKH